MPTTQRKCIYGGLTLDVDRLYIGSVTATTHQEIGITTLESNPWWGTVLQAPHGKGNKCERLLTWGHKVLALLQTNFLGGDISFEPFKVRLVGRGLTSHSAIFQLYSEGTCTVVQFPNFDLLPGTKRHGQLGVFSVPSLPRHGHRDI